VRATDFGRCVLSGFRGQVGTADFSRCVLGGFRGQVRAADFGRGMLSGFGREVRATDFGRGMLSGFGREVRAAEVRRGANECFRGQGDCGDIVGGMMQFGHGIVSSWTQGCLSCPVSAGILTLSRPVIV
jgi:hypothetical protein